MRFEKLTRNERLMQLFERSEDITYKRHQSRD